MELNPNLDDYVLYVDNLSIEYSIAGKKVYALSNVTFGVKENESLGIVGESGCGKSTLAMAVSHILPQNAKVTSGRVIYKGQTIVDENRGASFSLKYDRKERKIEEELKVVRWKGISIVFQGALDSLNPLFTVGQQLADIFIYKDSKTVEAAASPGEERGSKKEKAIPYTKAEALNLCSELLRAVGLDQWVLDAFPHQLSGGMKQRVIIAMAIALKPSLVIADEPTTSLDVITQYRIIEELKKLKDSYRLSILTISHDVSMVSHLSNKLMVMYAGRVIEKIPSNNFQETQHPYTYMLIESIPKITEDVSEVLPIRGAPPGLTSKIVGCPFYERCDFHADMCLDEDAKELRGLTGSHEVACVVLPLSAGKPSKRVSYDSAFNEVKIVRENPIVVVKDLTKVYQKKTGLREVRRGAKVEQVVASDKINLIVNTGESVALVGETGSGKTTLSRLLGLLEEPTSGELEIADEQIDLRNKKQIAKMRKVVQTIFQDPFQSINPRFSVKEVLKEPLVVNKMKLSDDEVEEILRKAMNEAELTPYEDYINKYPHQLSGGQRQRVSVARSLVLNPRILIADEPISMLDVSLRAGVLNLLRNLRKVHGVTLFYITHDIASAKYISDRIFVLYKGQMVESGTTDEIIKHGAHPYTIALVISSMGIEGKISDTLGERIFDQTEDVDLPMCKFAPRCPFAQAKCSEEVPPYVDVAVGHSVKCHFATEIYSKTSENNIEKSLNLSNLRGEISSRF